MIKTMVFLIGLCSNNPCTMELRDSPHSAYTTYVITQYVKQGKQRFKPGIRYRIWMNGRYSVKIEKLK